MAEPLTQNRVVPTRSDEKTLPVIIYVLYLLGGAVFPPVIGMLMAYVLKPGAGERAASHYIYQIRSFWIALAGMALAGVVAMVALPLLLVLIGFAVLQLAGAVAMVVGAWFIVRSLVGLLYIARGQAHPRPRTWLF